MKHTRRTTLRLCSFAGAALLALGGWALQSHHRTTLYRQQLEYSYLRSLQQLSSSMASISTDLEKGSYTGTPPQLSAVATRLWRECGTAKTALTSLPLGENHLDGTNLFLSQVGDYAMALARKSAAGQELTDEEQANLVALLGHAQNLREQVARLESGVASGELDVAGLAARYLPESSPAVPAAASAENAPGFEEDTYAEMEEGFEGYPRLIYDGPFSTHLTDREPELLRNCANFTREQTRSRAATAAGLPLAEISYEQDEHSMMPSYCFTAPNLSIGVTKQGGFVSYLLNSREVAGQRIGVESAKESAQSYLTTLGYYNMASNYHEIADGICIFNFAYTQGEVTCYTDLIKVGIALDTGGVVSLDARGYLSNHKERLLPAPTLTPTEAAVAVSDQLTIQSSRLTLIPSPGMGELLCYEFSCTGRDDAPVLVFVNAQTGAEEQILMLLISENGTLTV